MIAIFREICEGFGLLAQDAHDMARPYLNKAIDYARQIDIIKAAKVTAAAIGTGLTVYVVPTVVKCIYPERTCIIGGYICHTPETPCTEASAFVKDNAMPLLVAGLCVGVAVQHFQHRRIQQEIVALREAPKAPLRDAAPLGAPAGSPQPFPLPRPALRLPSMEIMAAPDLAPPAPPVDLADIPMAPPLDLSIPAAPPAPRMAPSVLPAAPAGAPSARPPALLNAIKAGVALKSASAPRSAAAPAPVGPAAASSGISLAGITNGLNNLRGTSVRPQPASAPRPALPLSLIAEMAQKQAAKAQKVKPQGGDSPQTAMHKRKEAEQAAEAAAARVRQEENPQPVAGLSLSAAFLAGAKRMRNMVATESDSDSGDEKSPIAARVPTPTSSPRPIKKAVKDSVLSRGAPPTAERKSPRHSTGALITSSHEPHAVLPRGQTLPPAGAPAQPASNFGIVLKPTPKRS